MLAPNFFLSSIRLGYWSTTNDRQVLTDDAIKQTDREDALFAQVNFKHSQIVKLLDCVLSMLSNLLSTATEHFLLKTKSPVEASQNKVSLKLSARQVALIAFPLFWLVIYFFLTPNPMLLLAGRYAANSPANVVDLTHSCPISHRHRNGSGHSHTVWTHP